ncbi:Transcriptional Regulator AraC family protein [Vibrio nigripulchritudo MADA3029]|uniref:helix-turn-helix transcriptional regulator n=1 Tax=Vibrio nigripulchritudo TaxID=28173 RepID=UPI0003B1870E|nr:AraC family transcriptional regulator [Vibrio nigripulchritudo]CCN49072.1 Transcriptional Regulator AraC family protein [Vibrio nigripulchritudo MADA3020]CCN56226.1 Transcriptional Regulator AraC family protein [Vibrio nigripulchritudo MADA3021]CCN57792.1 Transcriptional Regulator AraC family protein [Vibrio nigripulchritudo MADA3029]
MKSELKFYSFDSKTPSDCGNVLDIEFSSHFLPWEGVILEKGQSPHFYPQNVFTPYFYFALALDKELTWNVKAGENLTSIKAVTDDIWINPPNTPFTHDISEPCHFVILAIEEKQLLDNCPLNISKLDLTFLNNYNVSDPTIKGIMDLFIMEVKFNGRNGMSYLKSLLSLLSGYYIQNYSNYQDLQNARLSNSKLGSDQLDKIDRYIDENIGAPISIDDFADLLHCSKFYFLREFKKLAGVTPYQYLMNKRLEQAKSALQSGSTNLAMLSNELGFNDQSHFTRTFKAHFGVTPGQYGKR